LTNKRVGWWWNIERGKEEEEEEEEGVDYGTTMTTQQGVSPPP